MAFELLVGRVVATLPDSLTQRRDLLGALAALLPPKHPSAQRIREMQVLLDEHQSLQTHWAALPICA